MARLSLQSQYLIAFEEEKAFAARPTVPFSNHFFVRPTGGTVSIATEYNRSLGGVGARTTTALSPVARNMGWSIDFEMHPQQIGWWLKWALGSKKFNSFGQGEYRFYNLKRSVLPSFSFYVDIALKDAFGVGKQTLVFVGNKIESLGISSAGNTTDQSIIASVAGRGRQAVMETTGTLMIHDYAQLVGKTITISVNKTVITLTGVSGSPSTNEFQAATSNDATASSIETAIEAATGLINASTSTNNITLTPTYGVMIDYIETSAMREAIDTMTNHTNTLVSLAPLSYKEDVLTNNAFATPFMHSGLSTNWAGAGFASDKLQTSSLQISNTLVDRTYSDNAPDMYLDDLCLTAQSVAFSFDKDAIHAITDLQDHLQSTEKSLRAEFVHEKSRVGSNRPYLVSFYLPTTIKTSVDPFAEVGGGNGSVVQNYVGESIQKSADTSTSAATGTNHTLDVDQHWTGAVGDGEAIKFTADRDGFITAITLRMKTDISGSTEPIFIEMWTHDSGANEPNVAITEDRGGRSNIVEMDILNVNFQEVAFNFDIPCPIFINQAYWFVVRPSSGGSGTVIVDGDTSGTTSHSATTDKGVTWTAADSDMYWHRVTVDDFTLMADVFIETTAADAYPDAT